MVFFRRLLLTIAVLVLLIGLVGMLLPSSVHVERSAVFNTTPDKIWPHISNFKSWEAWSPWFEKDPNASFTYSGNAGSVGHESTWSSEQKDVGSGSQKITEVVANEKMVTALDFGSQGTAVAMFELEPQTSGTRVTWSLDSDFGDNFIGRYFGLMMDRMLGPDYEAGLAKLKTVSGG